MNELTLRERIASAIAAEIVAGIEGRIPKGQAIARGTANVMEIIGERPAERLRRENAAALKLMAEFKANGKGRAAAMIAARLIAVDKNDPAELEKLAQRFRRLWREHEKNERYSFAAQTQE